MPEHYRALVFLLLIAVVVHPLAGGLQSQQLPGAHRRRRNLWYVLTITAFLLGDFWVFALLATALIAWAYGQERNAPALFLGLLFAVPPAHQEIPGLGLFNFLFSLSFPRLLALVLLLPLFLRLVQKPRRPAGGLPRLADALFFGYLLVNVLLLAREASVTSAVRSAFYLFVDVFLPYFVFSRAFDDMARIRDAVASLVVAGVLLAAIGMFEASRHWLLYSALVQAWGSADKLLYLGRSGALRAMASTGHAIALGYVLAVSLLLYLPLRERMRGGWQRAGLTMLLVAGLLSALSRGPWLGAAAGLLLYIACGPRPAKNLVLLATAAGVALAILPFLPFGNSLLGLIPFFGTTDAGNVEYRQRLMENAARIIWRHPLLGSSDYLERLAEMGMVQGQGIIDIVNTYVRVALRSGLLGLACFAGVLLAAWFATLRARKLAQRALQGDAADLGRSLAAAQLAVIVTIATVSSIVVIPWVYWCIAGMSVAYARVVQACVREPAGAADRLGFA
ncbi:MAG TPA: O-antigen ligase family protein [Ramlibacter sp.]